MLEVWLLSSLIVVNVWSSSRVKHFSLCQGLSSGTALHTAATESTAGCTDRLCLITESSAGKVQSQVNYAVLHRNVYAFLWTITNCRLATEALITLATITHYCRWHTEDC